MNSPETPFTCLDFRRAKLADPRQQSAEAEAHLAGCPQCQSWARMTDAVEARLAETLAVPVPEGLTERVLLRARAHRRPPWQLMALAASVLFALTLGLLQFHRHSDDLAFNLAMAAAEHAGQESLERLVHRSADVAEFRTVLANFGGQLESPLGPVRYMHYCPIAGHGMGWHIVYETAQGEVTLLLVPGKADEPAQQTLEVDGMNIRVQRAGQGYYAIISHSRAGLDAASRDLQSKVRWL